MVAPANITVRCPSCGAQLALAPLAASRDVALGSLSCGGCGREFATYRGVVDLRGETPPTCWTSALTRPELEIARELSAGFDELTLAQLAAVHAAAHDLPARTIAGMRSYWLGAVEREAWTTTYMDFCIERYAPDVRGRDRALDAGAGSGGALPHLVARFGAVAGVDPDLPALLLAARRCADLGIDDRVSLVAGMLEQELWPAGSFDAVKCTDVIEHVADPAQAASVMASAIRGRGTAFVLTPNRWSLFTPEPHVRLWGVQFLPLPLADAWVMRTMGVRYRDVTTLLSSQQLDRILRQAGDHAVHAVPIEDKHLNPRSARGRRIKRLFGRPPLRWASRIIRPVQPTLEAVCVSGRVR